jgi:GAF domain-containing protein/HAMP domain-containing protein
MKIINTLSLRIKLISGFVLIALIVSLLSLLLPRSAHLKLTKDSIPLSEVIGEISTSFNTMKSGSLEFVATGEKKAPQEFREAADDLRVLSDHLKKRNQFEALPEDEVENLTSLLTRMETLGQEVIRSHGETLEKFEELEEIGDELEETLKYTPKIISSSSVLQQHVDDLGNVVSLLQVRAIEFMVTGEEKVLEEFIVAEVLLSTIQKRLEGTLERGDSEEASFIGRLDDVTVRMASQSRAVLDSHQETLELLERMEETEKQLDDKLADLQGLSEKDVDASLEAMQRNAYIGAVGSLVLAILLGLLFTRGILTPIFQLRKAAEQIGGGDLSVQAPVDSRDEIGQLAQIFNRMTDQLREAFARVEEQSQQRVLMLKTTADISRRLTTILDIDQLLQEVVNSIQNAFGYYHVHVYLIDQVTGDLVMREGTGDVGRQLKAKGHKLQTGEGIVGKVAGSGEAFLAADVDEEPGFVRNPLLPKTQAELAVPVRKGNTILGVLDMQSEEVGSFSQEDLTLMQAIADQVAVVLENARLFREAHAATVEAEKLTHRLIRESWQEVGDRISTTGYVFTKSDVIPVSPSDTQDEDGTWLPIMTEAIRQKELTQYVSESDNDERQVTCLSIPLILRNEVIGVIGIERAATGAVSSEAGQEEEPGTWTEDELATVRAITEQIALALDAARLARETERAAWRDRVVGEATARVWATDEIEEVMKAAVSQLGDQLRASEVVIRLGNEDDLSQE